MTVWHRAGDDAGAVTHAPFVMGEEPGAIVAGFDVHRRQITVDALDTATGEVSRGQIESTPAAVEEWVAGFPGRVVHVAVEACTGWLFVCRALERSDAVGHLAEPVETSALRGRKRRAKTDRTDAEMAARSFCARVGCLSRGCRLSMSASGARARGCGTRWSPSAPVGPSGSAPRSITTGSRAPRMSCVPWPAANSSPAWSCPLDAHERITVALEIIDLLDAQLAELDRDLRALARHQAGCRALMTQYGMGEISALVTLCELGDVTRLHASRQAVRMAGIDIGVHRSDRHAQLGKLTRQGSAPLRWALFEAAQSASHRAAPTTTTITRSRPADSHTPALR